MRRYLLLILLSIFIAIPCRAANEVLIQDAGGSSLSTICIGVDASLNPVSDKTNWTDDIGTDTVDFEMILAGVAAGAGRLSSKIDLGAVRALSYVLFGCVDFTGETVTGNAGERIDYYWIPSTDATAAQGNIAGGSGVDADADQTSAAWIPGGLTLAEFLRWATFIGSLIVSDDAAVLNATIGKFSPSTRWGQLVVVNNTSDPFEDDDVEMHQVLSPYVTEIQ